MSRKTPGKRARPPRPTTLREYLELTGLSQNQIALLAALNRAVISRDVRGQRGLGPMAAIAVERAMRALYEEGRTRIRPLTLGQLCPKLAKVAA